MTEEQVRRLMDEATKTNRKRDQIDRSAGFAAPSDDPDSLIRTAICALHCGLVLDDWNAVAEATVMLSDMAEFRPWEYTS